MPSVLCSGNLVLDILVRPADVIAWGATTWVDSIEQHLGGNGASTAYTLGKLGIPVRLVGMVGADSFGDAVLARLATAGVDVEGIRRSSAPTPATVALVKRNGDRALLHRLGASAEMFLAPANWMPEFSGRSHFHLGSPFGLERMRPHQPEILRLAQHAGLTTSIDTHWDSTGGWMQNLAPCLPYTDILFANEDEARLLTGSTVPAESAVRFRQEGARTVVLKLSHNGCAIFGPEGECAVPAFDVPVVDTTGAGDSFVGGFLAARGRGFEWAAAARFANAVAALAVQKLGAVEGVRTWQETEEWLKAHPA